jgi:hypothetical protein
MYKIISISISTLLLFLIGSCASIKSNGSKPAINSVSANFGESTFVSSIANSCPIVSVPAVNIVETTTLPQLFPATQGPTFQAKYQEIPLPGTLYPAYGCTVFTLTPQMQWQSYADESTYSLQISTDQNFADLVVNLMGSRIRFTKYLQVRLAGMWHITGE